MLTTLSFAILLGASTPVDIQDAQLAVVRANTTGKDADYFKRYCVGVIAGTLPTTATVEDRVLSTKVPADSGATWVERLRQISPAIVPLAECDARGEEAVHLKSRLRPVLVVVVGPAEVLTPHLMRFTVFSTSGLMTGTHTLYEMTKKGPQWQVTATKILLQA